MKRILMFVIVYIGAIYLPAQDTLFFMSENNRYNCNIIKASNTQIYSDTFIKLLSQSKLGSEYILMDTIIVIDKNDTLKVPDVQLNRNTYVSAHICNHQRNYSMKFKKISIDSYIVYLEILTDHRLKSSMEFTMTLQPKILASNGNSIYIDRESNLKITANTSSNIIMENLFLDNSPCPRTILFSK